MNTGQLISLFGSFSRFREKGFGQIQLRKLFNFCTTGGWYTLITCKGALDFQKEVKLLLSEEAMDIEHTEITTTVTPQYFG